MEGNAVVRDRVRVREAGDQGKGCYPGAQEHHGHGERRVAQDLGKDGGNKHGGACRGEQDAGRFKHGQP